MISKISKILFISNYEKELFIKEFPEFKKVEHHLLILV